MFLLFGDVKRKTTVGGLGGTLGRFWARFWAHVLGHLLRDVRMLSDRCREGVGG